MKCAMCNGNLVKKVGVIEFDSKTLGMLCIPDVKHSVCTNCGDALVPSDEGQRLIEYVREREKRAIGRLPISDFISLNEAAEILEITKQAFSKNPKIKNGLIYSARIGGRSYYNRRSVEQFKKTGNGKYLIPARENIQDVIHNAPKALADKWKVKQGERSKRETSMGAYPAKQHITPFINFVVSGKAGKYVRQ